MDPVPEGMSSRDRVLWAAAAMLGEGAGAALSVRSVAARAGVSVGSLRHHFPTQRALIDTVLTLAYDLTLPAVEMTDGSIPAKERLMAFLQRLVAPTDDFDAVQAWRDTFRRYADEAPSREASEEYRAIGRGVRRRIEGALASLQEQGDLAPGDNARRAGFLAAIVTGVSVARALPAESTRPQDEYDALELAVDAVLADEAPPRG